MPPEPPAPRPARRRRPLFSWVRARKSIQYLALLAFVLLFISAQRGGWDPSLANVPMRLDPLLVLANLLASKAFLAGSALAILVVLLTLLLGRAWCGWLCPLGTVLDLFTPRLKKGKPTRPAPPEALRGGKYGLLGLILVAALFGNLTLLFLDPLTIFFRTLTVSVWPGVDQIVTSLERALVNVPFLEAPLAAFDEAFRPAVLPAVPFFYRDAIVYFLVFAGVIALNWIVPRFWCRYLCPLGGLLGLLSKVSIFRRVVGEDCRDCRVCSNRCPTGTIDESKGFASDPSECTLCLDCLDVCPRSSIKLAPGLKPAAWQPYDPTRRQALATFALALGGAAILNSDQRAAHDSNFLIRPPGGRENDLVAKCVRCGECLRACPTGGLQPAIWEAGLGGLWTPVLIARIGPCDFSCNACGQACPVEAIPLLALEEKRQAVIGRAYIDTTRCIAWADHRDCIVCEEMCPIADKAIKLTKTLVDLPDGTQTTVQLPSVERQRCIGCGICEYKCPVGGEAAIRVHVKEKYQIY